MKLLPGALLACLAVLGVVSAERDNSQIAIELDPHDIFAVQTGANSEPRLFFPLNSLIAAKLAKFNRPPSYPRPPPPSHYYYEHHHQAPPSQPHYELHQHHQQNHHQQPQQHHYHHQHQFHYSYPHVHHLYPFHHDAYPHAYGNNHHSGSHFHHPQHYPVPLPLSDLHMDSSAESNRTLQKS
ncbi:hypothetical protein Esti_003153 [Eimeria stiedai]